MTAVQVLRLALLATLCSIFSLFAAQPGGAQTGSATALRINGAAMASNQVQLWADEFVKTNPGTPIVVTGSSAGKGFESFLEGHADVALASRPISSAEEQVAVSKGIPLAKKMIGYAGMAIITCNRNPINELTLEQLRKIFSGEVTNWKDVGGPDEPIRALTRRVPESGGAIFFQEAVLGKPYAPGVAVAESWMTINKVCVAAQDLVIGMGPALFTGEGCKILAIKRDEHSPGLKPTAQNLRDASYPIILPFSFYWNSETKDERIQKFADFCVSKGLTALNK